MNKLVKKLALLLVAGSIVAAPFHTFAQEEVVEEVVAAVEPVVEEAAPAVEEDENYADYADLVAQQGSGAYAFDFFVTSNLWTVIAAAMVFLMHLGFSCVESGLCRAKNTTNVLFKNAFIISIGLITYALIGFNTHYPGDFNGWVKFGLPFGEGNIDNTFGYGGIGLAMTGYADFIFQAMFAATGATIVSGAVAERVKLLPFMIFATLLVAVAYPVIGSWHWGGGWFSSLSGGEGLKDFAGSAVVHAFGGFAALACVIVLGPRKGKYVDGKIKPILGHSMPLATIGVLLLWFGWFGFNGGSVLSADPANVSLVFMTTALAAAAGCLGAIALSWIVFKTPDLTMALNGMLAGLVGITANADIASVAGSMWIGLIAGFIVVLSIVALDKLKIDDPVGAISVHGTCGIWGIVACALPFLCPGTSYTIVGQIIGVAAVAIAAFVFSLIVFGALKVIMGVRVSEEEEEMGLDKGEHGQEAYPDFAPAVKG